MLLRQEACFTTCVGANDKSPNPSFKHLFAS